MTRKVRDVDLLKFSAVSNELYEPVHSWLSVSQKTHVRVFFDSFFPVHFVAKRYILGLQQKCLNGQNNLPAKNTLVQLLAHYTDPESHNARRHRQTDGRHDDANSRSDCVAVRSAKNPALEQIADVGALKTKNNQQVES